MLNATWKEEEEEDDDNANNKKKKALEIGQFHTMHLMNPDLFDFKASRFSNKIGSPLIKK